MTVRRPKLLRSHPDYQTDFEDAASPAIRSLIAVAVSAGWDPDTVAQGLLALVRTHVQANSVGHEREKEMQKSRVPQVDLIDPV
jgi:hypothetical protein